MFLPKPRSADERILLAYALGVPLNRLDLVDQASQEQLNTYQELLACRATGVPIQHLTKQAHFRTITVEVGPGVFIPRPETEVMVGWALEWLSKHQNAVVVELCTGSGVISRALYTELPGLDIHAVELDEEAFNYASRNLNGTGIDLRQGDMAHAFPELNGEVDLIIANPPYVPLSAWDGIPAEVRNYDPHLALFSGSDGLDAPRIVVQVAKRLLRPGGVLVCEHAEVQAQAIVDLLVTEGFDQVRDHKDLTIRPRYVTGYSRGKMSL